MQVKTFGEIFKDEQGLPRKLTIRELINQFSENTKTDEVIAFGGALNVRPSYQRGFVYEIPEQTAVIRTVMKGYPLNVMYWAKTDDGQYELMDGQQRTMSICKFCKDAYSIELESSGKKVNKTFSSLDADEKEKFLNYTIDIYICDSDDDEEKMAWFRTINIAGLKLTEQEMRNAIFNSPFVSLAKAYFSRVDAEGVLRELSNGLTPKDYLDVSTEKESKKENAIVRQRLLEIALTWYVDYYNKKNNPTNPLDVDDYMQMCKDKNQRHQDLCKELKRYYEDVFDWVVETFPTYRGIMKGLPWGLIYNKYHDDGKTHSEADANANKIFETIDEIASKSQKKVHEAVLSGDMRLLQPRQFDKKDKEWAYNKQNGECPCCKGVFDIGKMEGDHIIPWSKGGKTERANLQMLCKRCNLQKSNYDADFLVWDNNPYEEFDFIKYNTDNKEE